MNYELAKQLKELLDEFEKWTYQQRDSYPRSQTMIDLDIPNRIAPDFNSFLRFLKEKYGL